jgi:hypothetical protein
MAMNEVEKNLANWRSCLFPGIPLGGLFERNEVAYKWKPLFRVWMLRELAFWRAHDLMVQSHALHQQGHGLGARILLRSGFETLGMLIYVNLLMRQVLDGELNFHLFGGKTTKLLLGARNNEEMPDAINILKVLGKCDKSYPGIVKIYGSLSESAHPNYDGMMGGYSTTNHDEYETTFSNRWMELHGDHHPDAMLLCMATFHHEYDKVWPDLMEQLEQWVEANDEMLEATKSDPLPN